MNDKDNEPVLCKWCKFMQLLYNPHDIDIVEIFKKINLGHGND